MCPPHNTPKVTAGLRGAPELWRVAGTKTAMVKPWARAMARISCPAALIAPIPMKISANVPINSARQGRSLSMRRWNQTANDLATPLFDDIRPEGVDLTADVIRIFLAQLAARAIGFISLAGALIGERRLLQCARGDCRVVVKQRHAHERLSGVIEMAALNLHVASEQTRLGIHTPLRLKSHDFLGDFLGIVSFVGGDFHRAQRE